MGVTGSGKSSFISLCCKKAVEVGHQLKACTTTVDVYAYEISPEKTVYLIDTPGFDDTNRSDTEVLREIASWLTTSYSNKVLLHGIIYLHRIADVRMQGSAKKNLLMFKKLCGEDALRKVILATTMWDKVSYSEAEKRERELISTPEFWGFMLSKGSTVCRHDNTTASAENIIERFALSNSEVTLALQSQMVNDRLELSETTAGKELKSEISKEKSKFTRELKDVRDQVREAVRIKDKEAERTLKEVKEDYLNRLKRLEEQNARLYVDSNRLHVERTEQLEKALAERERALAEQESQHNEELINLVENHQQQGKIRKHRWRPTKAPTGATFTRQPTSPTKSLRPFSLSICGKWYVLDGPKDVIA